MSQEKKIILVIGATGAQGLAVIKALLAPAEDGAPSPYRVRALTRDPTNYRARALAAQGVEIFQGQFEDFKAVAAAFAGVYGAWVNTDSFTVGEMREIFAGVKIFEIAKRTPSVRHYVWSSLDYASKKGKYNPKYHTGHFDAKGTVADFLTAQPSVVSDTELSWSAVSTGPYLDMLGMQTMGPLNKRADGTYVFAHCIGDGHMAVIALSDLGWWARWTFDHRAETSARNLEIASQMATYHDIVAAFTRVTGQPAVYKAQTPDEWWNNFKEVDGPYAAELPPGSLSIRENGSAFWGLYADDVITRDMEWLLKVHPTSQTVEGWMRETGYTGNLGNFLKGYETGDASAYSVNYEVTSQL